MLPLLISGLFAFVRAVRDPGSVYYGWWLLGGSVIAMALGSGVSFWAFGLYVQPLEDDFGWSRAEVSLGFSVSILVSGLAGPMVGRWIDVKGPRVVIIIGAVLTGLTYILMATTNELWQWYVYQSINAVPRQMMFFIPFQTLVAHWFNRRRGVALSILGSGFSLGGLVVVPVMQLVIDQFGWEASFVLSGVVTTALFVPLGLFLVRNSPADVGALVDGEPVKSGGDPPPPPTGATLGQALRTPLFWVLAGALMLFFYGMFGWLVHQIPFYESIGMSRGSASLLVAVAAGAGVMSRLLLGVVVDRVRLFEYLAMGLGTILLAAMTVLLLNTGPFGIALFLLFWVVGASAGPMMEALLLTRAFGLAHFGTIFGVLIVVETIGQILSPVVAGQIFDTTGSYDWALVMFMGTFIGAVVLFAIAARLPRDYASTT
jgi:sugar phosphate permease